LKFIGRTLVLSIHDEVLGAILPKLGSSKAGLEFPTVAKLFKELRFKVPLPEKLKLDPTSCIVIFNGIFFF
jgi:hypothetical protein